MALRLFTVDEKISALHVELTAARRAERPPGSLAQWHYEILKAIASDLRGRQNGNRIAALEDIEAAIGRVARSRTQLGYDQGLMTELAGVLIKKWPAVRQALEKFAQENVE
jgi:hypothetical protein